MNERTRKVLLKDEVEHRHEANRLLTGPGDAVLVKRGVVRSIAMACPDGCGENLTINLDRRAGPAWRHYVDDSALSIYPSVWRDTGCKSHFVVWRSKIYWCDWNDELDAPMDVVVERTHRLLSGHFVSYVAISDELGFVPWAVLSACHRLCRRGIAEAGVGDQQGQFRLRPAERAAAA